jgi:hypothetical protein
MRLSPKFSWRGSNRSMSRLLVQVTRSMAGFGSSFCNRRFGPGRTIVA